MARSTRHSAHPIAPPFDNQRDWNRWAATKGVSFGFGWDCPGHYWTSKDACESCAPEAPPQSRLSRLVAKASRLYPLARKS